MCTPTTSRLFACLLLAVCLLFSRIASAQINYPIPTINCNCSSWSTGWITGVTTTEGTTNIQNQTGCSANTSCHTVFTGQAVSVAPGDSFLLTIQTSVPGMYTGAWIDWNMNGTFIDSGEMVMNPMFSGQSSVKTSRG